ncbi:hypothetical protein [Cellulophaga sp. BC115SP]|uniref:hypothetical protein n=1 Tax=Cellulophaga sp. BC115SP TaxID=2683263 RepID=UPI001412EDF8|nr:hypothetical protein [Cellulophaga sp. BC115SP]NBB31186.1 hypothetical protein [Cellulophaga sp. BC115SP]
MEVQSHSATLALSIEKPNYGYYRFILSALLILVTKTLIFSQNNQLETDKGLLQSIAPYSSDVRQSILMASQNQNVLDRAQQIRTRSQKSFQDLIKGFGQKEQGYFYEVTRYPNVLNTFATNTNLRRNDVDDLVANTSSILKDNAWSLYRSNRDVIVQIYQLNQNADQEYQQMIQSLDPSTQSAFRQLANYPDVMTLMSDNRDLTARLGERYTNDREGLNKELSELHDSMVAQRQYDVAEYKKKLNDNPDAAKELDQAAEEYAQSNNYVLPNRDQDVYITNNYYNNNPSRAYYSNPYSYWCGYPYWYTTPLWYPSSYWYDFRFSFGIGSVGLYGYASYGFADWFYYGGYYRRYPVLYGSFGNYYRNYVNYYYGRPSSYYYAGRPMPYRNYDRDRYYSNNGRSNNGYYRNSNPNYGGSNRGNDYSYGNRGNYGNNSRSNRDYNNGRGNGYSPRSGNAERPSDGNVNSWRDYSNNGGSRGGNNADRGGSSYGGSNSANNGAYNGNGGNPYNGNGGGRSGAEAGRSGGAYNSGGSFGGGNAGGRSGSEAGRSGGAYNGGGSFGGGNAGGRSGSEAGRGGSSYNGGGSFGGGGNAGGRSSGGAGNGGGQSSNGGGGGRSRGPR